jgi:transcriptional regulator with XRE-family HTH domain
MAKVKGGSFGQLIRERRRQLGLTQQKVARRVGASTPYVGHLESGKRHPSDKFVLRIATVLGFDGRELYFLVNPGARELLDERAQPSTSSSWESFRNDARLRRLHRITPKEVEMLSQVALLGNVHSARSFIYILNTIRLTKSAADSLPQERRLQVVRCHRCEVNLDRGLSLDGPR